MTDSGTFKEEDLVWNEKHGAGRVALSDGDGVLVEFTGGNEELFEANGKKNIPLIKLDEDGYVLRMQREPDAMCALAKDAPAELIKTFIVDFGMALSAAALERHISGAAVPADEWKEWWKQTQVVLREESSIPAFFCFGSRTDKSKSFFRRLLLFQSSIVHYLLSQRLNRVSYLASLEDVVKILQRSTEVR